LGATASQLRPTYLKSSRGADVKLCGLLFSRWLRVPKTDPPLAFCVSHMVTPKVIATKRGDLCPDDRSTVMQTICISDICNRTRTLHTQNYTRLRAGTHWRQSRKDVRHIRATKMPTFDKVNRVEHVHNSTTSSDNVDRDKTATKMSTFDFVASREFISPWLPVPALTIRQNAY